MFGGFGVDVVVGFSGVFNIWLWVCSLGYFSVFILMGLVILLGVIVNGDRWGMRLFDLDFSILEEGLLFGR